MKIFNKTRSSDDDSSANSFTLPTVFEQGSENTPTDGKTKQELAYEQSERLFGPFLKAPKK